MGQGNIRGSVIWSGFILLAWFTVNLQVWEWDWKFSYTRLTYWKSYYFLHEADDKPCKVVTGGGGGGGILFLFKTVNVNSHM